MLCAHRSSCWYTASGCRGQLLQGRQRLAALLRSTSKGTNGLTAAHRTHTRGLQARPCCGGRAAAHCGTEAPAVRSCTCRHQGRGSRTLGPAPALLAAVHHAALRHTALSRRAESWGTRMEGTPGLVSPQCWADCTDAAQVSGCRGGRHISRGCAHTALSRPALLTIVCRTARRRSAC